MEVSKEAHVKFQAKRIGSVHTAEFENYNWWIAVIFGLRVEIVEQLETTMVSSSDVADWD